MRAFKKPTTFYFLFTGFLLLGYRMTYSQIAQNHYVLTNPNFQNYTMKNGLPSNFCYQVLQDKRGYIWFATFNGAARFDGFHYKYFKQQSLHAPYRLPSNWVIDLTEDLVGDIWMNTDAGICKYDHFTDQIINYPTVIKGWGKLKFMAPDQLFVSSWLGIAHYTITKDSLIYDSTYSKTENNTFHSLTTIGHTLLATPEDHPSLMCLNGHTLTHIKTIDLHGRQVSLDINSITPLNASDVLLNTNDHGLLQYNLSTGHCSPLFKVQLQGIHSISCSSLYTLGTEEFIMIGTRHDGLISVNRKTGEAQRYAFSNTTSESLCSNCITAITPDNNQGLWIATDKGVSYFHPSLQKNKSFYFYHNPVIPNHVTINCVTKINGESILIGTDENGLFLYHTVSHETKKIPGSENLRITCMIPFQGPIYLIGTNQGVLRYDSHQQSVTKFTTTSGKVPFVFRINLLNDSLLGICTNNGFSIFNYQTKREFFSETPQPENSRYITKDICQDEHGKIWVLRFFNGYAQFDLVSKTLTDLTPKVFLNASVDYHNMIESKDHHSLYISTSKGILIERTDHPGHYKLLKTENGLEGDAIENVSPSNDPALLYYTTPVGLYTYHLGTQSSQSVFNYENYIQKWFNQLSFGPDSLLIASVSDYFMMHNSNLGYKNTMVPHAYLESVTINGIKQRYEHLGSPLVLSHLENNLELEVSPNVYPESEKNKLYYKFSDSDTAWLVAPHGIIKLYHLLPNSYELLYFTVNNEGNRSSELHSFFFNITAPFYKTWWFISLQVFVIVAIGWGFYQYRKKEQRKLRHTREQISRDLHDELGANVSSIQIMANMISTQIDQQHPLKAYVENISGYSVQVGNTINDIIWNVSPKFDTADALIKKITRYASEILDAAEINYTIDVPDELTEVKLAHQVKYSVYLITKEAVNNAAKYSMANHVMIRITHLKNEFTLVITDDGKGFDETAFEKGNGLSNMKKRAKDLNAFFSITSAPAKGTSIYLKLKLTRS